MHEVLYLEIVDVNVTKCVSQNVQKYQVRRLSDVFFQAPSATKAVCYVAP